MHEEPSNGTQEGMVMQRLSANLRAARTQAGMTQEELAARAEVDHSEVSRLESGAHMPWLDTVVKLGTALGLTAEDLSAGITWNVDSKRFEIED